MPKYAIFIVFYRFLAKLLNISESFVPVIEERIKLGIKNKACLASSFQRAIRLYLCDPACYKMVSPKALHGFLRLLVIATSEAIAETHRSQIDTLDRRYNNTDADHKRLQQELKVKIMGPAACTKEGEQFILRVGEIVASAHNFVNKSNTLGFVKRGDTNSCIDNILSEQYSMPWTFTKVEESE